MEWVGEVAARVKDDPDMRYRLLRELAGTDTVIFNAHIRGRLGTPNGNSVIVNNILTNDLPDGWERMGAWDGWEESYRVVAEFVSDQEKSGE